MRSGYFRPTPEDRDLLGSAPLFVACSAQSAARAPTAQQPSPPETRVVSPIAGVLFVPPPDREARSALLTRLLAAARPKGASTWMAFSRQPSGFRADLEHPVETASDEAVQASLKTERKSRSRPSSRRAR
jgi:hypothetical protein